MSNVLVTGGAGFIGSHLVDKLILDGHDVTVLDNLEQQVHGDTGKLPEYFNSKATFINGDVRSKDDIKKAIKDCEIVFHDAAMVGVGQSMYQIHKYTDVNTLGTAALLEVILENKEQIKKLVVASSMSIYGEGEYYCKSCSKNVSPDFRSDDQMRQGDWEQKCPDCGDTVDPIGTTEKKPLESTSIYAINKKDQEEMCLSVGRAYKIPTVALRYFNVYGPRQSLSNPYTGVCAIFSSRIKNNNPAIIYEDGLQSRDFTSVHDIVQANVLAMNNDDMNYKSFNVGTGRQTSVLDVYNTLAKLYNVDIEAQVEDKFRAGDIRHCYADISRLKACGYEPSVSLEDGMRELVEWGKKQESVDSVERANEELKQKGLIS